MGKNVGEILDLAARESLFSRISPKLPLTFPGRMLEKDIESIVINLSESPDAPRYPYHNLSHTKSVVAHTKEMAAFYALDASNIFIVTTAAWFHDIGHLCGGIEGHEERGVQIMKKYVQDVAPAVLTTIGECIMATRFPSRPGTPLEGIICDADTYHFGTSYFRLTDDLVHQEMELRTGCVIAHWREKSLQLLKEHRFFTGYCKTKLGEGKRENIAWLESSIQ